MSLAAGDLKLYNCLNRPTDDTSAAGGAIDLTMRPIFTQFDAAAKLTFQSDSALDVQNATITGRDSGGRLITEVRALTGLAEVASVNTYARILSVVLASAAVGSITLRQGLGGTTILTLAAGEKGGAALFQEAVSSSGPLVRYDKLFWKNANGTWALVSALHQLEADATGLLAVGLAAAKNDAVALANRTVAPAGIAFVDVGEDQALPDDELAAGETIGVWIRQSLPASEAPHSASLTLRLTGQAA